MLAENENFLNNFLNRLRETAAHLQRLGDEWLLKEGETPAGLAGRVRDSSRQVSALADGLMAYSGQLKRKLEEEDRNNQRILTSTEAPSRKVRNGVITAMLISLVIVLLFCVRITTNWGSTRMNREADTYEYQLDKWLTQQKSILYMFTDMISTQPELMADYEKAVAWLDAIAGHYPEISGCYMANPYAEHPVIC